MARWTTRGSWIPTIPDPAPCFVKSGAGYAQQSYEKHSVVEPVRGGPHAGEAPELDMERLRNTRLDRSTVISVVPRYARSSRRSHRGRCRPRHASPTGERRTARCRLVRRHPGDRFELPREVVGALKWTPAPPAS